MSRTEQRLGTSREIGLSAGQSCPALFTVDVSVIADETVLTLHGELDIATQQQFADALAGVDESAARIVLDLSDLTFIDCANIGLIHRSRILAGLRGAHLELRSPSPVVQRIFDVTGLSASNGDGIPPIDPLLAVGAYERPTQSVQYR